MTGQQQAESEAIGSVVRLAWTVAVVARSAAVGLVALMMAECRQRPGRPAHPAVVEAMAEVGIDLCREFPKPLTDQAVRAADVVVTMGCGDACLIYPGKRYEDWPLQDPGGQPIEVVHGIRDEIDGRVPSWSVAEVFRR